jgi:hypothetical protein
MIKQENQCNGKTAYETLELCNKSAASVNDRNTGKRVSSYKCATCNKYHYGHNAKGKKMQKFTKNNKTIKFDHESKTHIGNTRFIK